MKALWACFLDKDNHNSFIRDFPETIVMFPNTYLKTIFTLSIFYLLSCSSQVVKEEIDAAAIPIHQEYFVDLSDPSSDVFKVTISVARLGSFNNVFTFAALGTYSVMDFGRYVRVFKAMDARGREIPTRKLSTNQWALYEPQRISKIYYEIADTWDTPQQENSIPEMLGTSIEQDYAFISGQGVFGFIKGLENLPIRVRIDHPSEWSIGTALPFDSNGEIIARNFGHIASTPILLGYLTESSGRINGSDVSVYTYSKTDRILTGDLMPYIQNIMFATYDFLGEMPIDTYTMLFIFDDKDAGGVEYHNSSAFVFKEDDVDQVITIVQDIITHEYFHLVIPFSIRSDMLDKTNFFKPTPSAHLWFFEGVTEWASDIIQLRSGLKSMEDYIIRDFRQKIIREELYGSDISLRDISLNSHRNPKDYLNVYSRGALVAALLDIQLLDVHAGRRGLREVIVDLQKDFGKERPLPEEQFFEILIDYCGPETEDFIRRYIIGNEDLPYEEYLEKIGVRYRAKEPADDVRSDLGFFIVPERGGMTVMWIDDEIKGLGIEKGDVIAGFNGRRVSARNYQQVVYGEVPRMDIGEAYTLQVIRNGQRQEITCQTIQFKRRHTFSVPPMLSPTQGRLREAWLKNL